MNPAFSLTFLSLGKIAPWDALFYVVAQFVGGIAGVVLSASLIGAAAMADPSVNYVVTVPGPGGPWVAFCGGVRNLVPADRDRSDGVEFAPADALHAVGRRLPGGELTSASKRRSPA